ncbi:MAG: nucleotide exchange factor GrpE [Oscillospiraceae bacterium]|nr:nucleotide exchange factor GrpE [Oscillospiraceae bacterium]
MTTMNEGDYIDEAAQEKEVAKNLEELEETPKTEEPEDEADEFGELENEIKRLTEEIKQKDAERSALNDKYLRIAAEYENFRKRTAKEKEGIYADATIDALKNILPVLDNFERAMQFSSVSEPEKLAEGIKLIYAQFVASLEKLGVEEIAAAGETFDPEIHNAVMHEQDDSQPENTVTEVMMKGYIKGDRVIRPAMVKVVN